MIKTISVKELRMNFPKVKKDLDDGINFVVIYRSKPLANLTPIKFYSKPFGDRLTDKQYNFPKTMKEWLKDWDKYAFKAKGGKKFDAVKLIRKDRGYDD
ncbi:hypothetical protein A3B60_01275 [Candidatus Peregrinibacteria bacterium RIFCSPLOWO2_01_FULL_39_12]|nr:MAG: hypothetical protein A3B60_01275 [Candidatus Peregrinibacteria bacterium RIFCSPLOWO2_01_FULL_39_12]OGJ43204.1 MAG: hypothetical protein A3I58_00320 [Candidatus Peregrinibacteria bacterium RIFCSPLOWO2_02_FULL_39_10]